MELPTTFLHDTKQLSLKPIWVNSEFIAISSGVDRSRLLSVSSRHSGVWIYALPSHSLGLCLRNDQTRISIGLHAGVNLVLPHSCVCGVSVASNGHHGLSCCRSENRQTFTTLPSTGLLQWRHQGAWSGGKHFSVGRQTSHVVQIGSYFKSFVTFFYHWWRIMCRSNSRKIVFHPITAGEMLQRRSWITVLIYCSGLQQVQHPSASWMFMLSHISIGTRMGRLFR